MNKYTYMIVTIEWMEEWFRRFDHEYFGGKLPVPELGLTHAKTRLGNLPISGPPDGDAPNSTISNSPCLLIMI